MRKKDTTKVKGSTRQGGSLKNHTSPASHTGKNAGPLARICSLTKASGGSTTFLPSRRTFSRSSSVGKWCRICQIRLGRKSTTAIAPAIQIHCLPNSRRSGGSSTPTVTAKQKNTVECLFSSPSPASTPNHSQRRGVSALDMHGQQTAPP